MRADELLDAGDMDGQGVWKQILAAVAKVLAVETDEARNMLIEILASSALS